MNEIKINLLPKEIFEKRRAERFLIFLIIGLVIFLFFLVGISFLLRYRVESAQKEVEGLAQKSEELKRKITALKNVETEQAQAMKLKGILSKALTGEIAWDTLLYQVGMVIPSDVWLVELTGELTGESPGLKFKGYTFGHPSVAEWLVRVEKIQLGQQPLTEIWLDYSQEAEVEGQKVFEFESTAKIPGVTALPTPGGTSTPGK